MFSILLVIFTSSFLSGLDPIKRLGRNTLCLYGSEYLIRNIVPDTLSVIGLSISIKTPMAAYLYAAILLILADILLVPAEKKLMEGIRKSLLQFFNKEMSQTH